MRKVSFVTNAVMIICAIFLFSPSMFAAVQPPVAAKPGALKRAIVLINGQFKRQVMLRERKIGTEQDAKALPVWQKYSKECRSIPDPVGRKSCWDRYNGEINNLREEMKQIMKQAYDEMNAERLRKIEEARSKYGVQSQ